MTIDPNNRKRRATRGYVHTHAGINPGYSALQQSYDEHGNPIDPNQPNPCNLHEVEVHADGNCLFRSVSDQMYLSEEYHELIRTKTVEYVKVEKDFFRDYIPNENFEAYVARKAKLGEWGDDLEIQALSEIYDCAVEIYDSEGRLQKTFHEYHGGFQQHQPTGEMSDLMDSEYSWLEGVPIPQPGAGGGGSSSSSSRGPQHSDLRADLNGHLPPHMMSQHVPRSVIRLVYRGQSHYNSLRDMNRSRNLPQILQVREKFLRKLGYPQHAVPRNLPGAIEDLAIEYRRRNKNLNMEAAQQHRMEMEKRGGASLVGGSNNVQGAKGEGLLSPRSGGAAGVHLAGGRRNPAAAAAEEQERRAMAESLALMQKQQDDDLNKAISMSLGGAMSGLTSRGATPSIGIGIGGGGGGTATSAPSDKTTPTLGPQQVGVESAASATSEEDQLLQEALLLSMQKDGGEAARNANGPAEQAAEQPSSASAQPHQAQPQPRPPPEQAGYPDAVLQCVSFGVPLEKALKAYEFAGADLDDMMLFLTTLS